MKIAILVILLFAQLPCWAHEGHDKAFANKDAMVATDRKVHITAEGQQAIGLRAEPVTRKRLQTTLEITGKVEPADNRINFVTSPVAGVISKIDVQQGTNVRKGQVLATLHSAEVATVVTELLDQRTSIQADITKARVQAQNDVQLQTKDIQHAETDVEREQKLLDAGITARKNYIEAVHTLDLAKARLEGTRRQLTQNIAALEARRASITEATKRRLAILGVPKNQIDKALSEGQVLAEVPILSPATGTIFSRDVTQGESVDTSRKLLSIVNLSPIWISLDIHPDQLSRVRLGQEVRIQNPVGPEITGTISSIASVVQESERTVHVRVVASNPKGILKPEMFVTASIITGKQAIETVVVPAGAVIADGGKQFVYVKYGDDFQPVLVKTGTHIRGYVEILDGLYEGDQVVVNGASQLRSQSMLSEKEAESSEPKFEARPTEEVIKTKNTTDPLFIGIAVVGGIFLGLFFSWLSSRLKRHNNAKSSMPKVGSHE
ncbi:MAG TPA: efflux RND transporter periplasmic adaptor subunit [Candidatus Melainabacteria bacterium]|jgi:multidrug efflux pump subunit AcrA (membrane-fusion protein)|nr:efflux RND transporter periplasmic adaptor subunit [Candidatus Obscuribacterales bacterium]HIA52532.1 efflux RND transporter periplasmic adaptor subunit [Candidatus Melainabacteria bacterium]HIN64068.1 efflux RND transporter periplasmic adaptor subunit [Candidatus Obscuribacterales bacterium]